jgi:hypothetical protein
MIEKPGKQTEFSNYENVIDKKSMKMGYTEEIKCKGVINS